MHLLKLNFKVLEGVRKAGLVAYQFNTVGVRCDMSKAQGRSNGVY